MRMDKPETKVEIIVKAALKAAQKTQKVREVTKILRTQFPELTAAEAEDGAVTAIAYVVSRASWIRMRQRGGRFRLTRISRADSSTRPFTEVAGVLWCHHVEQMRRRK